MKNKLFILLILTLSFCFVKSQNQVSILINNLKKSEYSIKDELNGGATLQKKECKKIKTLEVQIKGEQVNNTIYKRILNIFDTNNNSISSINENTDTHGKFIITDKKIKAMLQKGNTVKLYMTLNPANGNMMMRSLIIFVGNISVK